MSDLSAEERVQLCRCGHTRGNHRWYGIGGKHPCYASDNYGRCICAGFIPQELDAMGAVKYE